MSRSGDKRNFGSRLLDDDFDQEETTPSPLENLPNLFDVAMVFAVALMVALVSFLQVPSLLKEKNYTVIVNPGTPEMKMIVKEGEEIKHYEATEGKGTGEGVLLGKAYRLPDGRVVYVPSDKEGTP